MANVVIPDSIEFSEILRIIETKDLVHADVVNPLFKTLLLNTVYLNRHMTEMLERIETLATDNTYGGTELSAEATVTDANAQFAVIKKTSSTASTQILFSKPIEKLRKGLYSLLLRLKVTSITDSNGLIELKVTSGGTVLETRTITAQMFEKAGTFQTFGLNVEQYPLIMSCFSRLRQQSRVCRRWLYDIGRETCRIAGKSKKRNGKEKLCGAWFKRFNE